MPGWSQKIPSHKHAESHKPRESVQMFIIITSMTTFVGVGVAMMGAGTDTRRSNDGANVFKICSPLNMVLALIVISRFMIS